MLKSRIEKEAKMMLTPEQYQKLSQLRPFREYTQINHYYFANQQYVFRIREFPEDNSYLFTLKIKVKEGHREYEKAIPSLSLKDPYIDEICQEFNIHNIEFLGSMKTVRKEFSGKNGNFCLDISYYYQLVDYEFEYELHEEDGDFQEAYDFLDEAGIIYQESEHSKFSRFLQARDLYKNSGISL